ncbi:MAG: polysaccharide deacetylase family protein [Candidatus Omnitrophica bacterium]|nr:polysaccharide deacetylase family protein [Candidatus Omnitrophota bacterium]
MDGHNRKLLFYGIGLSLFLTSVASAKEDFIQPRLIEQKIEIKGVAANDTSTVVVEILPLYKGYKLAVTGRYDDNGADADLKMADVFEKYGYKATFFIYGEGLGLDAEKSLLSLGHGIGSHSVTHPPLGISGYNTIFRELLKSRIDHEARLDIPLNSFAFPYCSFIHQNRPLVQWNTYNLFKRAGYTHVVEPDFFNFWNYNQAAEGEIEHISGAHWLPGDGAPFGDAFEKYLRDEELLKKEPNIMFCMHAWAYTNNPSLWEGLEQELKRHANNNRYWYCTQTDYASYRFQRSFAQIKDTKTGEGDVSFTLVRPSGIDSNNAIPLSLKVTGAVFNNATVLIDGKSCPADVKNDESVAFSIPYPDYALPPGKIDALYSSGDYVASGDFPSLQASLTADEEENNLILNLKNSGEEIKNIVITYRLPLAIKPGIVRKEFHSLKQGNTLTDTIPLNWAEKTREFLEGPCIFVAQIDFSNEGENSRVYTVSQKKIQPRDSVDSYPKEGFSFCGPLTEEDCEKTGLIEQVLQAPERNNVYLLPGGKNGCGIKWEEAPENEGLYDPEFIFPKGRENAKRYLLTSLVYSPKRQEVKIDSFVCLGIWLNGKNAFPSANAGQKIYLNKGLNRVVLYIQAFPFLRLASPETGERLKDIRYGVEKTEAPEKEVVIKEGRPLLVNINNWLICGPFPNPGAKPDKEGFNKDYLKSHKGENSIEPTKDMEIIWSGERFKWTPYHSDAPIIDILQVPQVAASAAGGLNDILIYASANIISDREQDAVIGIGSDDGYKLWLNHKLIKVTREFRGIYQNHEVVKARLRKGKNLLLIKVDQDTGRFDFCVNLISADGLPLTSIRLDTN